MAMKFTPRDILTFAGITKTTAPVEELPQEAPKVKPTPESLGEKKILLTWKSPTRPERKGMNQRFIRTGIVIGLVIALFLALMQEFFLILVVASIVFFAYILINSPIDMAEHELSTHGIKTQGVMYYWYELSRFFFVTNSGASVLAVDTIDKLPSRLYILYSPADQQKIKDTCQEHIKFLEAEPLTTIDKAYQKVMDKFNFES